MVILMKKTFLVPRIPMYQGLEYEAPDDLAVDLIEAGVAERVIDNEDKASDRPKRRARRSVRVKALSEN